MAAACTFFIGIPDNLRILPDNPVVLHQQIRREPVELRIREFTREACLLAERVLAPEFSVLVLYAILQSRWRHSIEQGSVK
ncbi:MAG: hypothetical protein IKF42_02550 [Mogibacterium sp.]|nr:hypothetical protein [Mogibacterium sp.]